MTHTHACLMLFIPFSAIAGPSVLTAMWPADSLRTFEDTHVRAPPIERYRQVTVVTWDPDRILIP